MHPIIRSAETTIGWGIRSRQRARDRWFADSLLEGTGFELLVRGRVKLVVGRRRQRNRTARRRRCRCASVTFDQLAPRTRARGQGHRLLDRWAEDRTEDAVSSLARSRPVSVL